MFKVTFDTRAIEAFAKEAKGIELDVQKSVNWYINTVYRDLHKQHSRPYSYVTPPGDKRVNLRKRSGKLLQDLKNSKYTKKSGNLWEAGFKIRPGSYLNIHAGERGDPPTKFSGATHGPTFLGRIMIPLKASLNATGGVKPITGRSLEQMMVLPFHVAFSGKMGGKKSTKKPLNSRANIRDFKRGELKADFSNEQISKFHPNSLIVFKKSGRKLIPLYVLAKEISIPKRMFIGEKMAQYHDELYERLNLDIQKQLDRMNK